MLLSLTLPRITELMGTAQIDVIHAKLGALAPVGSKLLDLTIDLSAEAAHDCPPVSHYRLVLRDKVWLRRLDVAPGDTPDVGSALALFSTTADEPLEAPPQREVRLSIAWISGRSAWDEADS